MIDMVDPSFSAKRRVVQVEGGYVVYVTPPPIIGKFPTTSVKLTADQYQRYLEWHDGSAMIQEALPDLSDSEREILMSGLSDEDFYKITKSDED